MVFQNPDNQLVSSVVETDVAFGMENLGVPSGNDAAVAIAETVGARLVTDAQPDPEGAFVDAMNARAAEIGCTDGYCGSTFFISSIQMFWFVEVGVALNTATSPFSTILRNIEIAMEQTNAILATPAMEEGEGLEKADSCDIEHATTLDADVIQTHQGICRHVQPHLLASEKRAGAALFL